MELDSDSELDAGHGDGDDSEDVSEADNNRDSSYVLSPLHFEQSEDPALFLGPDDNLGPEEWSEFEAVNVENVGLPPDGSVGPESCHGYYHTTCEGCGLDLQVASGSDYFMRNHLRSKRHQRAMDQQEAMSEGAAADDTCSHLFPTNPAPEQLLLDDSDLCVPQIEAEPHPGPNPSHESSGQTELAGRTVARYNR